MGVEYHKCDHCGCCYYEECIQDIPIEGYGTVTLCDNCRDEYMDMSPSKFVDIDSFQFEAKQGDDVMSFTSFYHLQSFILGEPDDGLEPHYGLKFGVSGKTAYQPTNKEEAEKAVAALELECRQSVWKDLSYKDEDNTVFRPKRKWLEEEYSSMDHRIQDLKDKKQRLAELLLK